MRTESIKPILDIYFDLFKDPFSIRIVCKYGFSYSNPSLGIRNLYPQILNFISFYFPVLNQMSPKLLSLK